MTWKSTESVYRVALLSGGDSAERSISLASGECVAAALASLGHDVARFDPAVDDLERIDWDRFDCCFLALHGGTGEDGHIQLRLSRMRVPYTGSGPVASRLAMSKSASKERFLQAGVPTLPYVLFHSSDAIEALAPRLAKLGYPLVIKPDGQGSSLGVTAARTPDDLGRCIAESRRFDAFTLAEPLVCGREFTVAVLGRRALPPLEIIASGELFDFEAKYESVLTQYEFETGLSDARLMDLQRAAVDAAASLNTAGLVRVDLMLDPAGVPWVLEVNTLPGMTTHSLAPKAAAHAGMDLPALCEWMIRDCLAAEVSR